MSDVLTILGARPQFVKASVVSKALNEAGISEEIIHTGQHYDAKMSQVFFDELGIPAPTVNLEAGSGLHGAQTADMIKGIETYIMSMSAYPKCVMVYGDTNSTLAGALVAAKLHIPVVHVEAGLRSFNREMPEEINRVMTDHISTLLFCSSEIGVNQLAKEGIVDGVHDCGDVMYDAVLIFSELSRQKKYAQLPDEEYALLTVHRPSNTDTPENLSQILNAIADMKQSVYWPVHPRIGKRINQELPKNLKLLEPLSYFEMLAMLDGASLVLTDSGGLQKEAYWMQKQCITLRNETEWVETLEGGWNTLVGANSSNILDASAKKPTTEWKPIYGDGTASKQIAAVIKNQFL